MNGIWNTATSWGAPAKALDWIIAGLVLIQVVLGFMAVAWPLSPAKLDLFVLHKSTGMLVLALVLMRLAWRAANIIPLAPRGSSALEQSAAKLRHFLLYLVLMLMPISGWTSTRLPAYRFACSGKSRYPRSSLPTRRWPMQRSECTWRFLSCWPSCW